MTFFAGLLMTLLLAPVPGALAADPDVDAALTNFQLVLESEGNLSPEFKEALGSLVSALRSERIPASPAPSGSSGLWDRIHAFGDMRLRYEHDGRRDAENRNRYRTRFRIGAEVDLGDDFTTGFRIRTGNPDDPRSPHHNFGDMLDSLAFNLDRALGTKG